jgi:hypothetical protein
MQLVTEEGSDIFLRNVGNPYKTQGVTTQKLTTDIVISVKISNLMTS